MGTVAANLQGKAQSILEGANALEQWACNERWADAAITLHRIIERSLDSLVDIHGVDPSMVEGIMHDIAIGFGESAKAMKPAPAPEKK